MNLIFGNTISRRANFTNFCRIVNIGVRILKILDRHLKDMLFYITPYKKPQKFELKNTERVTKRELGHMTSPKSLGEVMSSISRH